MLYFSEKVLYFTAFLRKTRVRPLSVKLWIVKVLNDKRQTIWEVPVIRHNKSTGNWTKCIILHYIVKPFFALWKRRFVELDSMSDYHAQTLIDVVCCLLFKVCSHCTNVHPFVTHDRIAIFSNYADFLGHLPQETDKIRNNAIVISSTKTIMGHYANESKCD